MDARRGAGLAASLAALAGLVGLLGGCGDSNNEEKAPSPSASEEITLRSPEFKDRQELPASVSCNGAGHSPALQWSHIPHGSRSLALVVLDRDAPSGRFAHWTVWGLKAKRGGILAVPQAGTDPKQQSKVLGPGVDQGENGFGKIGWGPPCPPKGNPPHDYEFTLYSLDSPLGLKQGASLEDVLGAIAHKATARGTLTGVYSR
jgi:Raf kinase inhibitor-like YbhB/YbcL family protein